MSIEGKGEKGSHGEAKGGDNMQHNTSSALVKMQRFAEALFDREYHLYRSDRLDGMLDGMSLREARDFEAFYGRLCELALEGKLPYNTTEWRRGPLRGSEAHVGIHHHAIGQIGDAYGIEISFSDDPNIMYHIGDGIHVFQRNPQTNGWHHVDELRERSAARFMNDLLV